MNASGAGISIRNASSPSIYDTEISDNSDSGYTAQGGGVYIEGSTALLSNVTISGNSAIQGGGMYIGNSSPALVNVKIFGNTATGASQGGGIYTNAADPTLVSVLIYNNTAVAGGGMYNLGPSSSNPLLVNVTITQNNAVDTTSHDQSGGGGIWNDGSSPSIYNSIIWGNTTNSSVPNRANITNQNSGLPPIDNSILQGSGGSGGTSWLAGIGADSGGNIDDDPLFANAASDDFRLLSGSPAINAGSSSAFTSLNIAGSDKDLAGNTRIVGTIDMGAYEYQ
jgi:hypothetical protein